MEEQERREPGPGSEARADSPPGKPPEGLQPSEADVYRERWIRASADLDNLRKRTEREIAAARRQERQKILRDVLGVLDNLERALDLAGPQPSEWLEGVEATRRQMLDLLERHGAKPFESLGARFDPTRHEAVTVVEMPGQPAHVVDVIQSGYLLDGELLRAARVIVSGGTD